MPLPCIYMSYVHSTEGARQVCSLLTASRSPGAAQWVLQTSTEPGRHLLLEESALIRVPVQGPKLYSQLHTGGAFLPHS